MRKLPAPIRDNAVLIASLAAAVLVNGLLLWGFQGSMNRRIVLVVPAAPGGAPGRPPPGAKADAPPEAPKPPGKKPEKPPEAKKPEAKPVPAPPKKPEPKRETVEKKPEAAKPPAKANPGDADLAPLKMEVPEPMSVDMAQLLRVEIENRGSAPAGAHKDALYFSLDGKLDDKAVPLGAIEAGGTLAPGEKRWVRAQVLLPDKTPSGRAYLVVVLNADGAMPETNHANNQLVVPVMVDADSVPLGDPDERPRTTVAWISSKDFRELKARQSRTLQPSVQNEVAPDAAAKLHNQPGLAADKPELGVVKPKPQDPVAQKPAEKAPKIAPTERHKPAGETAAKPETPKPVAKVEGPKQEPKQDPKPVAKAEPPKPDQPKAPAKPEVKVARIPDGKGSLPQPKAAAPEKPAEKPAEKPVAQTPEKPPETARAPDKPSGPQAPDKPAAPLAQDAAPKPQEPNKPAVASTGEGATSTPLDTSSAPATQLDESSLEQQPGRVLVGKGVKINTARIQSPGPAALAAGVMANPRVAVTFNANGEVIKAEIIRSSGNEGWDHQVQLAMQRWTAEGEEVKKGGLVIRWTVILREGGD